MIRFEHGVNIWWGDITAIVAQKTQGEMCQGKITEYWGVFVYGRHSDRDRILVTDATLDEKSARELADDYAEKWVEVLVKESKRNPQTRLADTMERMAEAEEEGEDWKNQ